MSCLPTYKGKRYNSLEELYRANGVNPQQQQQAQQLYSKYLDTTTNPTIEGFKEFVSKQTLKEDREKSASDNYVSTMENGITVSRAAAEISRLIGSAMAEQGLLTNPNLRSLNDNKQLYGVLRGHVITLAEYNGKVHATAPRHESMHYILDYCLSPEEFNRVTEAAKIEVNKQNTALNKDAEATLSDALEYICDGFETFRKEPKNTPKTILGRLYQALVNFFNNYFKHQNIIEELYSRAEEGVYAKGDMNIYNNNPYTDERPLAVEHQYNNSEAYALLEQATGSIRGITTMLSFIQENIVNQSTSVGKIISKDLDIHTAMAKLYFKLTNENILNKYEDINVIYKNEKISLASIIDKYGIRNTMREIRNMTFSDDSKNRIVNLYNDIFTDIISIKINNMKGALNQIIFLYPIINDSINNDESNNKLAKIFVQALDQTINVESIASNVESFIAKNKEQNASNYQSSYESHANINDLVSLKLKQVVNNIKYKQYGKYDKYLQWQEFSSIILDIARDFRTGEYYLNKEKLSYDDILDILSKSKNHSMINAIYEYFRNTYDGYDNTNQSMMNEMMLEEFDPEEGTFDFSDYGYGFIIERINDYLNPNSHTGIMFRKLLAGDEKKIIKYKKMLEDRRDKLESNIKNTLTNFFNGQGKYDILVANTNGTTVAKTADNKKMIKVRLQGLIENALFERDLQSEKKEIEDTGIISKQIYDSVKKDITKANGFIITVSTDKGSHKQEVDFGTAEDRKEYYSMGEVSAIMQVMENFYGGHITYQDVIMNTKQGFKLAKGVKEHFLEMMKVISNNESISRFPNLNKEKNNWMWLDSKFIIEKNKGTYLSLSVQGAKNAEGNSVPSVTVINTLSKWFGFGTNKLQDIYKSADAFLNDKRDYILNPSVAGDFNIIDMDVQGGLDGGMKGKNWDSMIMKDKLNTFLNIHMNTRNDDKYKVIVQHTGDRKTTYLATLEKNNYFSITYQDTNPIVIHNKKIIGESLKRIIMFHKKQYDKSQQRLKAANITKGDNGILLYNGKEVIRDYKNMSDEAKHIERTLEANIDYLIKGDKYVIGNAGKNKLFGYEAVKGFKLKSNEDYYNYFIEATIEQKELFYDMLYDNNYIPKHDVNIYGSTYHNAINDFVNEFMKNDVVASIKNNISPDRELTDSSFRRMLYKFAQTLDKSMLEDKEKLATSFEEFYKRIEDDDIKKEYNKEFNKEGYKVIGKKKDFYYYKTYVSLGLLPDTKSFGDYMIDRKADKQMPVNNLIDSYYYTHILVNESISNIMTSTTDYAKSDEDFIKRAMGYTAPTSPLQGDINNQKANIGNVTRFALLQDIPGKNELYGSEDEELQTNGRVLYPWFYGIALRNSAGKDTSFISSGAVKTINHTYDRKTGKLHYMKCSEFSINYSEYEKNIGQEVYRISLDHDVTIKNKVGGYEKINLFDVFKKMYSSQRNNVYSQEGKVVGNRYSRQDAFDRANKQFLKYIWNTKVYDEKGNELGRAYNSIVHKVIFQSSLKLGQTGVNHWVRTDNTIDGTPTDRYLYPATSQIVVQEISNDNYGLQQNKIQSTQKQDKAIMSQLVKILGVTPNNTHIYKSIIKSLNEITIDKLSKIYTGDELEKKIDKYSKSITETVLKTYDARALMHKNNNAKTFEQVKADVITYMLKEVDKAIKPIIDGNIMVQQPTETYFTKVDGKIQEKKLNSFRYYNADGQLYTDKKQLKLDVLTNKNVQVGLQEAICAFPHQAEFGLDDESILSDVFSIASNSFYFGSTDYIIKEGKMQPKMSYDDFKKAIKGAVKSHTDKNGLLTDGNIKENIYKILSCCDYNVKVKVAKEILHKARIKKDKTIVGKQETKYNDISIDTLVDTLSLYMWNLNEACNLYALRIPTNNASSGFPTRIVEFNNVMDNTILTSPDKSILDGSDYDIDELNVYYPKIYFNRKIEEMTGVSKSKSDFFNAIFSYYGDTRNVDFILSSITTKNIKNITSDMDKSEHIINTPNYFFANQELNLIAQNLVGHMVNIQMTTSEMVSNILSIDRSILNKEELEWVNSKDILISDNYIKWFLDVTTELVNAATDSMNIGNALALLGITPYTSNVVAGVIMNMYDQRFLNAILEAKTAEDESYTKEKLIEEYGLLIEEGTDTTPTIIKRNETTDVNKAVRYAFEIIKMVCASDKVKQAANDVASYDAVEYMGRKTDIGTKLHNQTFKTDFDEFVVKCTFDGLALRNMNLLMVTDIAKKPIELSNKLSSIAYTLGLSNDGTPNGIANAILAELDRISKVKEDGTYEDTILSKEAISTIAFEYNKNDDMLQAIHGSIDFKLLLRNNPYWQNKIRMLANTLLEKNSSFYSEMMIESVMARYKKENKTTNMYDNNYYALQKEVDRLVVGNMIAALPKSHSTIKYEGRTYDIKTDKGRVQLIKDFPNILKSMKVKFDKKNIFLNFIKSITVSGNTTYGIENFLYSSEQDKTSIASSYNEIYQQAQFDKTEDQLKELSKEEREYAMSIRGGLMAIEAFNLLTNGFIGNSSDVSIVMKPYIAEEMLKIDDKVRSVIEKETKNITNPKTKDDDLLYPYIIGRMGRAIPGIAYDRERHSNELKMDKSDKIYTLSQSNILDSVIVHTNTKEPIANPYGKGFNMYGVNGRVHPIVKGNKSLRYVSDNMLLQSIDNAPVIIPVADKIAYEYIDGKYDLNIKTGDLILIGNKSYKVNKENNRYIFRKEASDNTNILRAVDTRRDNIRNIGTKSQLEAFLSHIKHVFPNIQIEYIYDRNGEIASVTDGIIYLNMDKIGADIPIHELAHVFTMIIKEVAPDLWSQLKNEAIEHIKFNSPIVRFIKENYGNLSTEDMVFEIIGNLIQRQQGDMMEAFLLEQHATDEEVSLVRKLWNSIKNFFKQIGDILTSMFDGDWTNMESMTIESMGNILMDAIRNGKVLSNITSQELKHLNYNSYYAINNEKNISNSQDLINGLTEYTKQFSKMSDAEIEDYIYRESQNNNGKIWIGSRPYDFSKFSEEDTRKKIRESIVSSFSQNMPIVKENIIKGLNGFKGNNINQLAANIQKTLGKNEDGLYLYDIKTCYNIARELKYDKTKKYYTLDDMITNKNGIMDTKEMIKYKKVFAGMKDIGGYNPIVTVEYINNDKIVISLHDITGQSLSYSDPIIGQANILFKYGVSAKEASLKGITLTNNSFDVRSLMLTIMTNKLKKEGVIVREVKVAKVSKGNKLDSVDVKTVNMYEVNKNIEIMNQFKEFTSKIDNEEIREVFNTPADKLITNDVDYEELLASLYEQYYQIPGNQYNLNDPNVPPYDYMIKNNYYNLVNGKLSIEERLNLILWRLHQLSNIPSENKSMHEINESRLLLEAYKALKSTAKLVHTMNKVSVLKTTTSIWNTFDVDSEELQFVRSVIIQNQNKIVNIVRKRKDITQDIWEHFAKQSNQVQRRLTNPYFMYEHLFATIKTKDNKDAFAGRILWTKDLEKDEFATQAIEKNISDKDLEMANKLCDEIEHIWIEMLKHEAWKKNGTEEVYVNVNGKNQRKTLTDKEWLDKLISRGYKRGMIPIMQKNYIDGAKSLVKRMGLETKYASDEYADATPEIITRNNNDKLIDEITNIFMNQLSIGDTNLEVQTNENNLDSIIDPEQGYKGRNMLLGLVEDENTKEMIFETNKGAETNANINKDLEFLFTFFDLSMTRKRIHERETLPVLNEFVKLLEAGKAFSIDKNNDAVIGYIRDYAEMCIKGSSHKIKDFGVKIKGSSVGEYLTAASKGMVGMQMFMNLNVAINSALINTFKAVSETISNDQFVGNNMLFGYKETMKHLPTAYKRAIDLQIIRESEHETYNPGYKGSVSNKSIATSFMSNILNWATDSFTRASVMTARMKQDGVLDAYVDDVYDDTKDRRFFNADGTQTKEQKILYEYLKQQHRLEGIQMRTDDKKELHLAQPYTWEECNAIKEYADKRLIGGYSNTVKAIMGNSVLGRQALMYFNWFPSALKGMIGGSMNHETIFKYIVDEKTGKVYKDLYFSEGMLVTLVNVCKRLWQSKGKQGFSNINSKYEKQNLKRLFSTIAIGVLLKIIYNFMVVDDDDDDDEFGFMPDYRIMKNLDYASEGMFLFLFTDGLQRMSNPFPLVDNITKIFDTQNRGFRIQYLWKNVPMYSSVNAITEVSTGDNLTDIINESIEE